MELADTLALGASLARGTGSSPVMPIFIVRVAERIGADLQNLFTLVQFQFRTPRGVAQW